MYMEAGISQLLIIQLWKIMVQVEVQKPGDTANEICLAEAARIAATGSRFNADYSAPARQTGTITYHFIPQ